MTRGRTAALLAVLVLVAAALVLSLHGSGGPTGSTAAARPGLSPALLAARTAAALPACPPGLSTELPDLHLPCLSGGPDVRVAAAPGRPLLVNLWGTWCGPCVREVPDLVAFARRAGDRVGVVGVATEDDLPGVYAFAKQFGIDYPLVADDDAALRRHLGSGVPKTLLVTADGHVASVQVGGFASEAAVEEAVATHLGVRL